MRNVACAVAASAFLFGCGGSSSSNKDGVGTGPASAVLCTSTGKNAWETYGATGFVAVNQAIFANVVSEHTANGDTNLGASFDPVIAGTQPSSQDPLKTFEGKLAAFLVYVYGGPTSITYTDGVTYEGDNISLTATHTGFNITQDQYNYFVNSIIVPALTSSGVKMEDITSCFAPPITATAFEAEIIGH